MIVEEFIDLKGFKATGNRLITQKKLCKLKINKISLFESLPHEDELEGIEANGLDIDEPESVPQSHKTQTKLKF